MTTFHMTRFSDNVYHLRISCITKREKRIRDIFCNNLILLAKSCVLLVVHLTVIRRFIIWPTLCKSYKRSQIWCISQIKTLQIHTHRIYIYSESIDSLGLEMIIVTALFLYTFCSKFGQLLA